MWIAGWRFLTSSGCDKFTALFTTAQASSISPQPGFSSPRQVTAAPTPSSNNTVLQPSDTGVASSNPPQPVLMLVVSGSQTYLLPCKFPSLEPHSHLYQPPQAQLGGAPLPITLPLSTTQSSTSGATLLAALPIILPLMAFQANTSGASLRITLPLMASQANTSGATLPPTISLLSSQAQPVKLQLIAQQAAQLAAKQAVARVLTSPSQPQSLPPLPAALHNFSQLASHTYPHSATVPTTIAGAFQPYAATTETISSL